MINSNIDFRWAQEKGVAEAKWETTKIFSIQVHRPSRLAAWAMFYEWNENKCRKKKKKASTISAR